LRDEIELVGKEAVGGVSTTHYIRAVTTRTYYDFGGEVKVAPPLAQDG
jgi:hypothetical protein